MDDMLQSYPKICERALYSEEKISALRSGMAGIFNASKYKDNITIVVTGSFGRYEASEESDLDLFVFFDVDDVLEEAIPEELGKLRTLISEHVKKDTGDTGTFGLEDKTVFSEMLSNIGGDLDDNKSLTRRMLMLLEGEWLYGGDRLQTYRKRLLERYIKEDSPDGYLSKFFLNEIIRYYRTIATDFEHKVTEDRKPWGLRSLKLRFSRKLLYFGGIVTVAEISQLDRNQKVEKAEELLRVPVLDRIARLSCEHGTSTDARRIMATYESFIGSISDAETRASLESVEKEKRHENEAYRELRELSQRFSGNLASWIENKYSANHEIHHSLIF